MHFFLKIMHFLFDTGDKISYKCRIGRIAWAVCGLIGNNSFTDITTALLVISVL